MSRNDFDAIYKIILIGDSGVGKSNIFLRYTSGEFAPEFRPTLGAEFSTKIINIDKEKIKIQIWDTSGTEQYRSVNTIYYKGALGALIVFDISKRSTFENVEKWLQDIRNTADSDIVILLVGNKADLAEFREVKIDEAATFAQKNELSYIECSALENFAITEAFQLVIEEIYKTLKLEDAEGSIRRSGIPLDEKASIILSEKIIQQPSKNKDQCC